jgi:hypothetical protein
LLPIYWSSLFLGFVYLTFNESIEMTISYVREILTPKVNDRVLTAYGKGVVIGASENNSTQVCLLFGTVYFRTTSFVHKMLTVNEYRDAMEKLEEYRQSLLEMNCMERQVPFESTYCVKCLLANEKKRRLRKPKVQPCDVCGNPVCPKHKDTPSKKDGNKLFVMCLDCKQDLDFGTLDIHNDNLQDKLIRLMTSFDRMVIQLSFCINELCGDVAAKLSSLQVNGSKVKIGTLSASFVSGGLAVAGTLTLLTPAGIPLISTCTSARRLMIIFYATGLSQLLFLASTFCSCCDCNERRIDSGQCRELSVSILFR